MTGAPHSLATARPLPFWRTVSQAYVIWARNLAQVLRISWLWLLLMAPVLFVMSWLLTPVFNELTQAASAGDGAPRPSGLALLAQAADMLVKVPMLASIAVAWHRLVLRDEHFSERAYLRLDRVVLVYAGLLLLLILLPAIPHYVTAYAGKPTDAGAMGQLVANFLGLILGVTALYVAARLSILLPARALERNDITLGRTWKETRGNGWKLLWGHVLCTVPITAIAGAGPWWLLATDNSRLIAAAGSMVLTFIATLGVPIAVGFLSLAYRHFLEEPAGGPRFSEELNNAD